MPGFVSDIFPSFVSLVSIINARRFPSLLQMRVANNREIRSGISQTDGWRLLFISAEGAGLLPNKHHDNKSSQCTPAATWGSDF